MATVLNLVLRSRLSFVAGGDAVIGGSVVFGDLVTLEGARGWEGDAMYRGQALGAKPAHRPALVKAEAGN